MGLYYSRRVYHCALIWDRVVASIFFSSLFIFFFFIFRGEFYRHVLNV